MKLKKTFFCDNKMLPQTKAKIHLLFCFHIGNKKYVLEEVCWHLRWWYPIHDLSIAPWKGSLSQKRKSWCIHNILLSFQKKCWCQKFLELKWKKFWMMLQKWLNLSKSGSLKNILKTMWKSGQRPYKFRKSYHLGDHLF